jgi:hypothetical protein
MRLGGSVGDISSHSYNMANWSTARSGPTIQQYKNVAKRRMQREPSVTNVMNLLTAVPASMLETPSATASASMAISTASMVTSASGSRAPYSPAEDADLVGEAAAAAARTPYSPAEDPHLVGEAAAAAACKQRKSHERAVTDRSDALHGENSSWDFMMVQMKDWDERQQNWNNFRKDMDTSKRGKLARRLGLSKR